MASLSTTLASLRRAESGSFKGNYGYAGERTAYGSPRGAYGITDFNWRIMTKMADMTGANIRSQRAQDAVAANVMQQYHDRYGSWDLAVAAWYGGTKSADVIVRNGGKIRNASLARLVKKVGGYQRIPDVNNYPIKGTPRQSTGGRKGWTFPVAGKYEFSGGSFMDKHTKGDRSHHAIDIYAESGTAIVAPVAGTITKVGTGGTLGGNTVTVQGNDGITYYIAHMSKHAKIEKGQKVMAGHQLGFVGNTGSAKRTKAHAHFSMKKGGKALNPYKYLKQAEADGGVMSLEMDLTGVEGHDDMQAQPTDPASAQAGTGMLNQLVSAASGMIAGGQRLDPRQWIDPKTEELDLTKKETIDGSP